jgi:predicted RNA-binding protein
VVPLELDEIYPLSQHETTIPLDNETLDFVAKQAAEYITRSNYQYVTILNDFKNWREVVNVATKQACKTKQIPFASVNTNVEGSKKILTRLENILRKQLSEKP